MKQARKSNRVSWAAGTKLTQVKLFLSEDCPSKVGQKVQDHIQTKTSWMLQSNTVESNDSPPGFGGNHLLKREQINIPLIKWKKPPSFTLSNNWRVAAGEESNEKVDQKLREMRVLESVYPRLSSIPPCPSVSLDVEHEHDDDSHTPIIPIIPIEEEESINTKLDVPATFGTHTILPPQLLTPDVSAITKDDSPPAVTPLAYGNTSTPNIGANAISAASAALAAIMKSSDQRSMIDPDLLVNILCEPKVIEKLINDHGLAAAAQNVPPMVDIVSSDSKLVGSSGPSSIPPKASNSWMPVNQNVHSLADGRLPLLTAKPSQQETVKVSGLKRVEAPMAAISCAEPNKVSLPSSDGNLHPVANQVRPTICAMPNQPNTGSTTFATKESRPVVKDVNYYKNLIRQHGTDSQDKQNPQVAFHHSNKKDLRQVHNIKGEVKNKIEIPCMFFKTSKGCRKGSYCPYKHDTSDQWRAGMTGAQNVKRLKLSVDI